MQNKSNIKKSVEDFYSQHSSKTAVGFYETFNTLKAARKAAKNFTSRDNQKWYAYKTTRYDVSIYAETVCYAIVKFI